MTSLLLATTSRDKVAEIRSVLAGVPIALETLDEHPGIPAPDETGSTFAENARAKALYYAARTGLPSVADDSGLEIDALAGAPGVHSARFEGPGATYPERFAAIFRMLDERNARDSAARFISALTLVENGRVVFEAQGTVEGRVASEPRGNDGFGYDPIFYYPELGCTLAEISQDAKSAVSHRGKAFRQLRRYLEVRCAPHSQ